MRGIARDWVTAGFYRFGFGRCFRLGQCVAQPIATRGRSVGLNVQSGHRKWASAYERCSHVYGGTEKVPAGACGGGPSSRFSLAGFRALLEASGVGGYRGDGSPGLTGTGCREAPQTTGNRQGPGPCGAPSPGAVAFPIVSGSAGRGVARLWYFGVAPSVRWG